MYSKKFLAIDLGAESGRVFVGILEKKLKMIEIHRFVTKSSYILGSQHWDVLSIFEEIKEGLKIYRQKYGLKLDGIGIDSWGVDFALLDKDGKLISNPYHYRDKRTEGVMELVFKELSGPRKNLEWGKKIIFSTTGIQFMRLNTLYQLYSMRESPLLKIADKFLMTADFFNYLLSGKKLQEFTLATTSQMYDPHKNRWSKELLKKLKIPCNILPEIIQPGTILDNLLPEIEKETGIKNVPVIAVASHDTASAVAAVPDLKENHAYLSSGTWSLLGVELKEPLINDDVFKENFTNEGGVENTFRFLKNIVGLWLIQQCKKKWNIDYTEITKLAKSAKPFSAFVDCDDPRFINPVDMEQEIINYCKETGQDLSHDKGAIARCIFESLAMKYRYVVEKLEFLTKKKIEALHIIGGGCRNKLLCQFTANATKLPVYAGLVEATAIGNILLQIKAKGIIKSLTELRKLVADSFTLTIYEPRDTTIWDDAYNKFLKIIK